MPNNNNNNKENNNLLWLLIAGILGIAGFAIFGNKAASSGSDTTNSNFTQQPQTKKFGCGCNKGS